MTSREQAIASILSRLAARHGLAAHARRPAWVQARLERAANELTNGDVAELAARALADEALCDRLGELLRVSETCFYRDPPQWEALRALLPQVVRARPPRALSVGCSTGEEAWTVAMLLDEACGFDAGVPDRNRRDYRVLATDRSELVLSVARAATYPAAAARHLPPALAARYLVRQAEEFAVSAVLAPHVSFVRRDLLTGVPVGRYDVIVCKNVLLYMDDAAVDRAVATLWSALEPGGVLLVARSEVPRVRTRVPGAVAVAPGVTLFRREP